MAKKRAGRESGGTVDTREKAQSEPKSARKAEPAEDEEPEAMKGMGRYIVVAMQAVLVFIVYNAVFKPHQLHDTGDRVIGLSDTRTQSFIGPYNHPANEMKTAEAEAAMLQADLASESLEVPRLGGEVECDEGEDEEECARRKLQAEEAMRAADEKTAGAGGGGGEQQPSSGGDASGSRSRRGDDIDLTADLDDVDDEFEG